MRKKGKKKNMNREDLQLEVLLPQFYQKQTWAF